MLKLDKEKLVGLKTFDDHLQERYGGENSPERKEFEAKAKAWYYAELLKDERKRQNVTQKVLAEKIGKKREYISALEKGQTDQGRRIKLNFPSTAYLSSPHSIPLSVVLG